MLYFLVLINILHHDLEGHIPMGMLQIFGAFIETWQHREKRLLASGPWLTLFSSHPGCVLNHEMCLIHMCGRPEVACPSSVQISFRPVLRGVGGVTSNDVVSS